MGTESNVLKMSLQLERIDGISLTEILNKILFLF